MADALRTPDPALSVRALSKDRSLPPRVRKALARADEDGVRMTALLVAKLRFERLVRASPEVEAWADAAPEELAPVFRRYHAKVPESAFFPAAEAELFRQFCARHGVRGQRDAS